MDQGLAAAFAGFASAAGAALGAGVTARGARVQALQQAELDQQSKDEERQRQNKERRRQDCLAFQARLGEVVAVLDEYFYNVCNGKPVSEVRDKLLKAETAVHLGFFDLVVASQVRELESISGSVLQWIDKAARAVVVLGQYPDHATNPDSPLNRDFANQRGGFLAGYEMFSRAVQDVLPAA